MHFPGGERLFETNTSGDNVMVLVRGRLWGPEPQLAVHANGYFHGSGESYEIARYSAAAELQRLIRLDQAVRLVTEQDIERYKQQRMEDIEDENDRRRFEEGLAEMPFTKTLPAYEELMVDAGGNLWVEDYPAPGSEAPSRWRVFDATGQLLGTVETPLRFTVFQIGPDYVLGRWLDEFDIEHIQIYELIKPELTQTTMRTSAATAAPGSI